MSHPVCTKMHKCRVNTFDSYENYILGISVHFFRVRTLCSLMSVSCRTTDCSRARSCYILSSRVVGLHCYAGGQSSHLVCATQSLCAAGAKFQFFLCFVFVPNIFRGIITAARFLLFHYRLARRWSLSEVCRSRFTAGTLSRLIATGASPSHASSLPQPGLPGLSAD